MNIKIYTDGAYSSKTKVGGWSIVVVSSDSIDSDYYHSEYGHEYDTTNNRMELYAVAQALRYIYDNFRYEECFPFTATVYTDSAYISNCFKDGWYKKWKQNGWRTANHTPVLNQDLWEAILQYYEWVKPFTTIEKVEGHNGNKWNEIADKLAVAARTAGANKD